MEGGELGAAGLPSPALQVVGRHHHRPGDHPPVEEDALQRVAQLFGIHLQVGSRGLSVTSHEADLKTLSARKWPVSVYLFTN